MPGKTGKKDPRTAPPVEYPDAGLKPGQRAVTVLEKQQREGEKKMRNRETAHTSRVRKKDRDTLIAEKLARVDAVIPKLIDALLRKNAELNRLHLLADDQFHDQFEDDDACIQQLIAEARTASNPLPPRRKPRSSAGKGASSRPRASSKSTSPHESTFTTPSTGNISSSSQNSPESLSDYHGPLFPQNAGPHFSGPLSNLPAADEGYRPAQGLQVPFGMLMPYPVIDGPPETLASLRAGTRAIMPQNSPLDGMTFDDTQIFGQSYHTPAGHASNMVGDAAAFASTVNPASLSLAMNNDSNYESATRSDSNSSMMFSSPEQFDFSSGGLNGGITEGDSRLLHPHIWEPLVPNCRGPSIGGTKQNFFDFTILPSAPRGGSASRRRAPGPATDFP